MDEAVRGGAAGTIFGEKGVAPIPLKSGPIGSRQDFQSNAEGIGEGHSRGHISFFKFGTEAKRPAGNGEILHPREENGSQWSQRSWSGDQQACALTEPGLVKSDGGDRKDQVAQPVGQAKQMGLIAGSGSGDHGVASGILNRSNPGISVKYRGRRGGCRCGRSRIRLPKRGDPHRSRWC